MLVERNVVQIKTCKGCGISKPVSEFHKARQPRGEMPSRGGLGVAAECKACRSEARKPGLAKERHRKVDIAASGLKQCGTCRECKPLDQFHTRRASKDGLAYKCIPCVNANTIAWKQKNPDAFKRWREENLDERLAYCREWGEANKEHRASYNSEWAKLNPHKVNALIAKRRAAKIQATPVWADQDVIRDIYAEAARLTRKTGIRHEVDHIYPLQGKLVCGLHCEANLQILTKTDNIRKLNRMPEELGYV